MPSGGYPDIPGVHFVSATGRPTQPERADYPYKLEVVLTAPRNKGYVLMHGFAPEVYTVQARTRGPLDKIIADDDLEHHLRLRKLVFTGPGGDIKRIEK